MTANAITTSLSNNRATFAAASKAWLFEVVLPHPKLTDATKVVCTAIYGRFNTKHYNENGGELYAFPGWKELVALTGLSRETINQSLKQAEEYGVLRVERGRRLASGRRGHNKYFAAFPGQKSGPGQGQNSRRSPGQNYRGSPGQKNRQEEVRVRIRGERNIIGESKLGQNFPDSDSDSKKESRTPEQAAVRPEGGKAVNGSSDSVALPSSLKTPHPPSSARPPSPPEAGSGSVARYLCKRAQEDAAARTAAEGKSYPIVEASPELTRQINGGRR